MVRAPMLKRTLWKWCLCCNKPIFQKHRTSKHVSIHDVRTYLDISKSMSVQHRMRYLEQDCEIDYNNAIEYIDKVEQIERLYHQSKEFKDTKPNIDLGMSIKIIILLLCLKVIEFSTISSLVYTILHSTIHST